LGIGSIRSRVNLPQQGFKGEFLNLALQLLGSLFGLPFEVLDLPLHRRDLLFLLPDP
jgi:hypothetical protein